MRDFTKLEFWRRSHLLVLKVYKISQNFPKEELFGLTSQMRRSAVSIPSNIAEGCGRDSVSELNRFLIIAVGSASELQYQILLCKDLFYIDDTLHYELDDELITIKKLIYTYSQKLKADS